MLLNAGVNCRLEAFEVSFWHQGAPRVCVSGLLQATKLSRRCSAPFSRQALQLCLHGVPLGEPLHLGNCLRRDLCHPRSLSGSVIAWVRMFKGLLGLHCLPFNGSPILTRGICANMGSKHRMAHLKDPSNAAMG